MALFGLRYDLRSAPGSVVAKPALYRAALEQCAWADRLGFAMVTLSEHHGSPDGYLPSPLVMAAAIAARTERLRIMISTLVATLYDPVRLAEDFAVLDNLSNASAESLRRVERITGREVPLVRDYLDACLQRGNRSARGRLR